jgi:hypothetical protein
VTSPQYHTVLPFFCNLPTPFNVAFDAWSAPPSSLSPPTAAVCHPRHPQPVDAETERRERIRNIEFKVLMYTQLAVLNNQHLRDFDMVVLKNGPHICKCRSAECMACIWEAKLICYSGNPGIRGGFTMQNPVFITWLHMTMLIDIHTPLIIPNRDLLMQVMVRLLTSIRFLFDVLTIAIFELSVVPLNKSCYHKTIQLTKMSMQTIATTNPVGGTLKEPMLYSRQIIPLAD